MNDSIIPTYKLPAEAYYEQSWLDKEKQNLFGGNWLYAGLETDLPEVGSYTTVTAGFNELIVIRDEQNELRALHNVCRHRGAQLVQGEGRCRTLVCPYHKWAYRLDGQLRGIASRDQFDAIETETLGLHKGSVASWMGLIFVHSDEHPPVAFDDWIAGVKSELDVFEAVKLEELKSDSFVFDANWKLYIENHIDWLHLWYVHPQTLKVLDHSEGEFSQHGLHWISFEPFKEEFREDAKGSSPLIDIPHIESQPERYSENGAHFIFPNLPIFTGSSFFILADLVPLSPEKTKMNIRILGVPGGDIDAFLEQFNAITKGEDANIIENIQKNIRSEHFNVGPIAVNYERAISDFHDNYLKFMA